MVLKSPTPVLVEGLLTGSSRLRRRAISLTRFKRRLRDMVLRETRDVLRGEPPAASPLRPVGTDAPSDDRVNQVVELCLQVGDALLSNGEAAADAISAMTRLAGGLGLTTVEIDITFTSITMTCRRGRTVASVTAMRIVHYRSTDLSRLAAITHIIDDVARGELGVEAADQALIDAVNAPHQYPRWVATAGWGGLSAALALLLGGGPVTWLTAFVISAGIDRIGRVLSRRDLPPFFLQMVGGFMATVSTLGLLALGAPPSVVEPSLVIAASITVLLSGLSVVNAVQDAISGQPVTAAGRGVEVALLSAGLLAGVVIGLKIGVAFQLSLDPAGPLTADLTQFGVSTLAAAIAAGAYALAGYAPPRSLAAAGLAGGVGWAAYGARALIAQLGPVVATGLAAVVIGCASELIGRHTRVDRHVIVLAGIVPLLPGLATYRGFYELASAQQVEVGLVTLTLALAIGLALAAGVTLGQFIAQPRRAPGTA
ncbi:MAG: threonine/serine exporter family protein [Microlunatus sp.]|nr:threonine/serine exporter family protein [Microlunatus sp.]